MRIRPTAPETAYVREAFARAARKRLAPARRGRQEARAVVAAMSLSRMGIYRILSGLPVTAGTHALLRDALERREGM